MLLLSSHFNQIWSHVNFILNSRSPIISDFGLLVTYFLSFSYVLLPRLVQSFLRNDVVWCQLSSQEERGITMDHSISDWTYFQSLFQEQILSSVMLSVAVQKSVSISDEFLSSTLWFYFYSFKEAFMSFWNLSFDFENQKSVVAYPFSDNAALIRAFKCIFCSRFLAQSRFN